MNSTNRWLGGWGENLKLFQERGHVPLRQNGLMRQRFRPCRRRTCTITGKQTRVCLACTGLCKLRERILQFVLGGSLSKGNCFSFLKKRTCYGVQVLLSCLFIINLQVYCSLILKETVPYKWRVGMWVFFQERMSRRRIDIQGYSDLPCEGSGYICLRISSPSCPCSYPLAKNKIWTDPCPFAEKVLGLGLPLFCWALWQPCRGLLL